MTLKNFALRLSVKSSYYIAQLLSLLIQLLRPLLGPDKICPFTVGCTQYAIMQLKEAPLKRALIRIVKRLALCNPFTNLFKKNSQNFL